MSGIGEADKVKLESVFEQLENDVKLVMFTQETECEYCSMVRELVEDLAALSDKIHAEIKDFVADAEAAKGYGIDKIPAVAIIGQKDFGVRFYGVPAGYEFTTLVQTMLEVSRGDSGLPQNVLDELGKVDKPVHMQVMITPT